MKRQNWYNLWRSYRVFKKENDHITALLVIAFWNHADALLLHRLLTDQSFQHLQEYEP